MAAIAFLLGLAFVLGWMGFELRGKRPQLSQLLFGLATLSLIYLGMAFFQII